MTEVRHKARGIRERHSVVRFFAVCVAVIALCCTNGYAEESPEARSERIIQELIQLDPQALMTRLREMRTQADALSKEADQIRAKAATTEAELTKVHGLVEAMQGFVKRPEAMVAAPAMPVKTMAKPAATNFNDHVFPNIIEKRCIRCHRDNKREGGLSMETFNQAMDGGSSGQIVLAGNPDSSRMMRVVMQTEEPYMPPKGKPLTEEQIGTLREWIATGAREEASSKVMLAKNTEPAAPKEVFIAAEIREGPPPMPEVALANAEAPRPRGIAARAVATSQTANLVAIGGYKQILLYELDTYKLLGVLPFPEGEVYTMTFSLNGELLLTAGGEEGDSASAIVWEVRKGERVGSYGHGYDTILAADISPDHQMIALGGPDRKVRVYDAADGELFYQLDSHTDWIYSIKFSPDGELLASADRAGNLLLWQAANGRPVEPLRGHNGAIHDMSYTYDSNVLASAGADGQVFLWDTWKYSQIRKIGAHSGPALSVNFSRNNQLVSSGQDGQTKLWALDGKNLGAYEALGDWVYQTRFGKSSELVLSGNWAGDVVVWNAETKKRVAQLTTNPTPKEPETKEVVVANAASADE